jgi:O-antigen ligase
VLLVALMLFGAQPSSAELKPQASRLKPIAAALAAAVLGCLLLTKSRSGWAGVLVGCGGLVATALRHRFLTPRRLLLGAAAIAALVVGAIFARGLDREVLTETGKSLGYRLQYWRSSLGMIQDHPWFGCGPGNFQDYYTAYKLPEASEEIRDPHNFVLELAATAGIPAALAILAVLVVFLRDVWRAERRPEAAPSTEPFAFAADMAAERWMAGGAMVGLILALAIGALVALPFDLERLAIVGVTGAATWVLLGSWRRAGTLRPAWVAMAVVAMAVHHLAAGGINFPGVSGSLWLLLALGSRAATLTENVKEQVSPWRKTAPIAALALASVAGVACFQTGYRPVLREAALVDEISELMLREPASAARQHDLIEAAALADPLASEPYRLLAREAFEKWMQRQSAATKERFDGAVSALLKSQPRSNTNWLEVGQWLAAMYERSHNPADARSAVAAATRAVELYPNSASNRAALAEILSSTGDKPSAITEAKEALRLDEITPHLDKKLKPDVRERMRRTIGN